MSLSEFIAYHAPALEHDEVRHGLILSAFARASGDPAITMAHWSLGRPGACAIETHPFPMVLAALNRTECDALAELTAATDYRAVVGPDATARWFADRASELGDEFSDTVPQRIYAIDEPPRYPGASGHARPVTGEDAALLADWRLAFQREAVPLEPVPPRDALERSAAAGEFLFWIDNGRPVALAGIVRRLKQSAAISGVYTPPDQRGRGYAGSVTAAAVERIHAGGHAVACLYADRRNPASNRCYVKIGFKPLCESLHIYRRASVTDATPRPNPK